jgi:hypothetical protein
MPKILDKSACRASVLLNRWFAGLSMNDAIWDEQRPAEIFPGL